ncbi:MAG TPA: cobalamin biosynthesis protein CobQ [Defluviitoga tunisiensis]|jgi:nucleoside-triphosphatase THEP1|nr:cobalamin biosynthesis protein CobQ [Defluviitoga tunisiensis]HOL86655.1 cobalamin biosynthesis protein CobQ [Defluviitoga tunisiensis]
MLDQILNDYQSHIFIGMGGSGKTEIAINIAIKLKEKNPNVAIVDLDVVTPYFRVRDKIEELKSMNLFVITPPEKYIYVDLPIVPAEVGGYLVNPNYKTVLDVGGDEKGATVLGSLKNFLDNSKKVVYFVVNTRRPYTQDKNNIKKCMFQIEKKTRTKIDFLICNTHLKEETTNSIIEEGERILESVSKDTGVPVLFTAISNIISENFITRFEKLPIKLFFEGDY